MDCFSAPGRRTTERTERIAISKLLNDIHLTMSYSLAKGLSLCHQNRSAVFEQVYGSYPEQNARV